MADPGDVRSRPIGIFDSGLGGLTVLKAIAALLPKEHIVYFGDSGRAPYGSKSPETIIKFSCQNVRFLREQAVKMIVIACNTASSRAYEAVRDSAGVPVVEVVRPGAAAACRLTRSGRIGVIGTRGTIESNVYIRAIQCSDAAVTVVQRACPLFVSLAEEGWWDGEITRSIAAVYLRPLLEQQIDTLVLGCTHYPLLSGVIAEVCGPAVTLVQAGQSVAAVVRQTLAGAGLLRTEPGAGHHTYYTSDSVDQFQILGSSFLAETVSDVHRIDIERY
jgi:glutamate racemase